MRIHSRTLRAVPAAPNDTTQSTATASAARDGSLIVAGGGVQVEHPGNTAVVDSPSDAGGRAWTAPRGQR